VVKPVMSLWHDLQSHCLSNRSYQHYNNVLLEADTATYRELTPEIVGMVCRCDYLEKARRLITIRI
jgi:hypothetical protein